MINEQLKQIYQVQLLDSHMQQLQDQAKRLDRGTKAQATRDAAVAAAAEAEAAHKKLHQELTDTELELKSVEEKKAKFEKRLFEGMILNPKELDNTQKEVDMLGRLRAGLDDKILELWDSLEKSKVEAERAKAAAAKAEEMLATAQSEFKQKWTELDEAYKKDATTRHKLAQQCDAMLMKRYEHTRDRNQGVGISRLNETVCSVCGNTQSVTAIDAIRAGETMVTCDSCARLLFLP